MNLALAFSNFALHYIAREESFHFNGKNPPRSRDLFLLPKNKVTYYKADEEEPWSYYWIGISGTKVVISCVFQPCMKRFSEEKTGWKQKRSASLQTTHP